MNKSFLAVLAFCAPFNCKAYEYFLQPIFSASERYNDNINMNVNPLQANWITTISPGLHIGFRNENERFMSGFTWNHLAYTNQSELDFDEQLLNANYENKLTDRLLLSLVGFYNNRAALNSNFQPTLDANGNPILDPNSNTILGNRIFSQQGVESINVGPSITYSLDDLNSINLQYSYSQTSYDKNGQGNTSNFFRSDYNYHQLSSSLSHIHSERDTMDLTLSTSRYESKFTGQNQLTYNSIAQVGWQHRFTEQLTASISGGLNYAVTDTTVLRSGASEEKFNNTGLGKIFSISLEKSFEKGSISLGANQNQSPTSQGLQTQTSIVLNSEYKISERLATGLTASYSTAESAAGEINNLNFKRTNYAISPNISWIWTPEIQLGLSYNFRQQELQTQQQSAQGNILQFQFSYSPQLNNLVK
jgi:hypothetical protein